MQINSVSQVSSREEIINFFKVNGLRLFSAITETTQIPTNKIGIVILPHLPGFEFS
jgi:hypothetical protein